MRLRWPLSGELSPGNLRVAPSLIATERAREENLRRPGTVIEPGRAATRLSVYRCCTRSSRPVDLRIRSSTYSGDKEQILIRASSTYCRSASSRPAGRAVDATGLRDDAVGCVSVRAAAG